MKKILFACLSLVVLGITSCGNSNLNKMTILSNCEKLFFAGTATGEEDVNYFYSVRVDSVIDDITPINPDALMDVNNKIVKICYSFDKINYDNEYELTVLDFVVYDTKTKKEYKANLRDNESQTEMSHKNCFITVDVPKDTKIEDLSLGAFPSEDKNYADFLALKNGAEEKKDEVKSMNLVQTYDAVLYGSGKVNATLKTITYNVSDTDPEAKELKTPGMMGRVAKVDVEYELTSGDEADLDELTYLFTEFRKQFVSSTTPKKLEYSIKGQGTKITISTYFIIYANEKITALTNADSDPSLVFEL